LRINFPRLFDFQQFIFFFIYIDKAERGGGVREREKEQHLRARLHQRERLRKKNIYP